MSDNVTFRTKSVKTEENSSLPKGKTKAIASSPVEVEVPFTSYQQEKGKPLTVEYFDLGKYWDDPDGGFTEEIDKIEGYFKAKIEKGEIADTVSAIKKELKKMEKLNSVKGDERIVVKIGTIAAYIDFLAKTENINKNWMKYGH